MREETKILVVGATGFVGGHIARALDRQGYAVRAIRRETSETWHLEGVDLEWVYADLDEPETLDEAVAGCAGVIHAAGYYPGDALDVDAARRRGVSQLRHLFDACLAHRVARVVYISSPATLGIGADADAVLDEHDFYVPGTVDNAYFEVKQAMEAEVYRYVRRGLPVVITIPSAIFGPGDLKPTTGRLLLAVARGRLPATIGRWVNVVDVRDVASSIIAALERGRPGRRYILGGANMSVDELVEGICEKVSATPPRFHLPVSPVRKAARFIERAGRTVGVDMPPMLVGLDLVARARRLSDERARAELNHQSRAVESTLSDALAWFQTHDYLQARAPRR